MSDFKQGDPPEVGTYEIQAYYIDDQEVHVHEATWDGSQWDCVSQPAFGECRGWRKKE